MLISKSWQSLDFAEGSCSCAILKLAILQYGFWMSVLVQGIRHSLKSWSKSLWNKWMPNRVLFKWQMIHSFNFCRFVSLNLQKHIGGPSDHFTPNDVKKSYYLYLQCLKEKAKAIPKHQVYSYTTTAPLAINDRAGTLQTLIVAGKYSIYLKHVLFLIHQLKHRDDMAIFSAKLCESWRLRILPRYNPVCRHETKKLNKSGMCKSIVQILKVRKFWLSLQI